jgi:hypothetical protein
LFLSSNVLIGPKLGQFEGCALLPGSGHMGSKGPGEIPQRLISVMRDLL